jgi:hypothetical protein
LGDELFKYNSDISRVIIPEGITEIPYGAFYECTNLVEVEMPSSITSIVNYAFRGCTSLSSVIISKKVNYIGFGAFASCSSLTEIHVDKDNSFYFVEDGVLFQKYGEERTLLMCYPAGKTETSYIVPSHVEAVNSCGFEGAKYLTEIQLHDNITTIYSDAFRNCTGLTAITIPELVKSVENTTFYGCTSLKNVNLPNGLEKIYYGAFMGCTSLETIAFPESLTSISNAVFEDCTSLSSIIVMNPNLITLGGSSVFSGIAKGAVVYVPSLEAETIYEADANWAIFFDAEHIIYDELITGVEDITISNNGEPVIYNISGIRVKDLTVPGVYIINGKKVLVK